MEEIMKPIAGFEGYFITNFGRVLCNRKSNRCIDGLMHEIKLKAGKDPRKYYNVICCNDKEQKTFMVHRLVAEYFVPGYFDGAVVNHIDGNNKNNRSDNLEWVSQKTNVRKSYISSGVGPKRHYDKWKLYSPSMQVLGIFDGINDIKRYIVANSLDISCTSLQKYYHSKGYTVERLSS